MKSGTGGDAFLQHGFLCEPTLVLFGDRIHPALRGDITSVQQHNEARVLMHDVAATTPLTLSIKPGHPVRELGCYHIGEELRPPRIIDNTPVRACSAKIQR